MEKSIGMKIKLKRIEKGFSLEQLANKTNLSIVTLSHVETGKVHPNFKTILAICEALEISTKELFNNEK